MKIRNPEGYRRPVDLYPLSTRLTELKDKKICFFISWQNGTLYDGNFSNLLKKQFEADGAKVTIKYKRRAFDQNDKAEREDLAKEFDGIVYIGASSCSTSKFVSVYGGYLDSVEKTPTVGITYETFVKDCHHANHNAGTNTRMVFTDYPGDGLSESAIKDVYSKVKVAFTAPLTAEETKTGKREFKVAEKELDVEDPQQYLFDNKKTDGNPVILPTSEKVNEMMKGTSLDKDFVVAERIWPECLYVTVETVAIVSVMAGLKKEHFPIACAIAKAYSDCPGQALVVSTNSFGFLVVVKGKKVDEYKLNYKEHAMSSVPGHYNAPLGRFLRLLQITIGGWEQGENAFGVIGNPMLGSAAIAENPAFSKPEDEDTLTLITGCWSYFGNYMNMTFQSMIDMAKHCDYQTGLYCVISPKRAEELTTEFGSLEKAGDHYQQNAKITLKEFWDGEDWHSVFTKPQLELGTGAGELQGYPKDYLVYFEDKTKNADKMVPAFPRGGIRFVVSGGSASKMMRDIHGLPVAKIKISDYR